MNNSKIGYQEFELINWKSIVIGSVITFSGLCLAIGAHYLQFFINWTYNVDLLFLIIVISIPIIEGLIVAYMNKPIYKDGIKHVVFATLIGYIIFYLFLFSIGVFREVNYSNLGSFINNRISLFMSLLIPVFLGSFIGTSIKKTQNKNKIDK